MSAHRSKLPPQYRSYTDTWCSDASQVRFWKGLWPESHVVDKHVGYKDGKVVATIFALVVTSARRGRRSEQGVCTSKTAIGCSLR
jgi:hypothetical protein